ncbi:MAG: Gfo/Idh/MocA family oxidoreductase [Kiritimatiellae bacterium]|jgi:predicted dehydrogenase|nr:Gfo/Idh/MocA family oxidoreductase [Kiritimatiellia bacterium]
MSKKFKVVLVGCGGITGAWMKSCETRDDLEIVGVVDLDESKAIALRDKHEFLKNADTGSSLQEMLDKKNPDIVFDCTVPVAHPIVTITALEHGCHVLGEKPLADNLADAEKMVAVAERTGKTYAVIQNRRYIKEIVALRKLVQSGKLGDLTTVNADFYVGAHFDGFRVEMEHVLLVDMAIHTFDMARYLSNTEAVSVYCHEWNPKGSWYSSGASVAAIFEMADGSVYNYRGSWCPEGLPTSWEAEWRLIGEKGTAIWDGAAEIKYEIPTDDKFIRTGKVETLDCSEAIEFAAHAGVINEFLESLKTGSTPQTVCYDNIKSLKMVLAAVESAETGKKIRI